MPQENKRKASSSTAQSLKKTRVAGYVPLEKFLKSINFEKLYTNEDSYYKNIDTRCVPPILEID